MERGERLFEICKKYCNFIGWSRPESSKLERVSAEAFEGRK
jgi:hypothetical protein